METIRIDILQPKAKQLLLDLVELKLIRIKADVKSNLTGLLDGLRNSSSTDLTLDEITKEVEAVRASRNEKS